MTNQTDNTEESSKLQSSKKKWPGLLGSISVLALIAGLFLYFFLPQKEVPAQKTNIHELKTSEELSKLVYLTLPEMIINLRTTSQGQTSLLKCTFVLLLQSKEDAKTAESAQPQVLDSFQSHIRELSLNQLEGSAGIERLRQTLTERINAILTPISVQKILIKEFLTQ